MSIDTLNPEGMTFEEWVCAAGVALCDYRIGHPPEGERAWPAVKPYTESYRDYVNPPQPEWAKGTVLLVCHGNGLPPARIVHRSRSLYPKKLRDAWRRGEDPTEWRTAARS